MVVGIQGIGKTTLLELLRQVRVDKMTASLEHICVLVFTSSDIFVESLVGGWIV